MRNDKKAKRKVCVEGFELRAIEGRTIINFYLLRNVHDGSGRKNMVYQLLRGFTCLG